MTSYTSPTERLGILKGHTRSVLCCKSVATENLLVTGGEDGLVCTHDLRSQALTARLRVSHDEAVPSILISSARPDCVRVSAGCDLFELDLRKGSTDSCVQQQTCTTAEINQLASCPEGNLLAAADDDGCVTIIDPSSQPYHCQKLHGRHDNICSSVLFRQHKHNQVISGGLDCKLIHWDVSSKNILGSRQAGTEKAAEPKVMNPPMVHCLATPPTAECPAAQLVAAACGDGTVAIWDLDKDTSSSNKRTRARQRRPEHILGCDTHGHRAAATCLRFTDVSASRLISGSNDRQLYLWQLGNGPALDDHDHCPVAAWRLSRKVNDVALSGGQLYIADTSKNISIYDYAHT